MRIITEERLKRVDKTLLGKEALDLVNGLIDECAELNTWQPIETAPKDRPIILYRKNAPSSQFVGYVATGTVWSPTHWKELPKDPD